MAHLHHGHQRDIHNVSINDDGNLFVACMDDGIRIYDMEPLIGKLFIDSSVVGSVSICKLLHRTNLIAIVGGGSHPKFAENAVLIWDDDQKRFVLEFTFPNQVLSLKTRRDRLFVVERYRIHCFSFPNSPAKLFSIETRENPMGICEVTPLTSTTELQLLAYPGHRLGTVQLLNLMSYTNQTSSATMVSPSSPHNDKLTKQYSSSPTLIQHHLNSMLNEQTASSSISPSSITAHTSEIATIALNRSGTLLATASKKGTLIRIFRTIESDGVDGFDAISNHALSPIKICEFRRGLDQAMVYGIVFSPDSEYVLVSSDKGTVHIFALKETRFNRRSKLSMPLVNSAHASLAKFTVAAECACVCSFGPDRRSVYAICVDGTFHKYNFKNDGTCIRESFDNFMNIPEERSDTSAHQMFEQRKQNKTNEDDDQADDCDENDSSNETNETIPIDNDDDNEDDD